MNEPFHILLVEDNPDDVELARRMLALSRAPLRVLSAPDGEKALAFLRRKGSYATAPRPDLILLDLHMPVMDGREFLRLVKADPGLKSIPVVILTTSNAAEEIVECYGLGASAYVSKTIGVGQFPQLEQTVEDFWIRGRQLKRGGA